MVFDKDRLAQYIIRKHDLINSYSISPLKLQKTLYLIYSMWMGNASVINEDIDSGNIELTNKLPEELFDANFEAWKYGPVDIDVYKNFKDGKYARKLEDIEDACIEDSEYWDDIKKFVNNIIEQCLAINDFSLVTVAQDKAWEKAYRTDGKMIKKEDIYSEYYDRIKNKQRGQIC